MTATRQPRRPRRWDAVGLPLLTSLTAGALALVTVTLVARRLGPTDYADFAVVWGCFFGIGGALSGLQQEVTRSLLAEPDPRTPADPSGARAGHPVPVLPRGLLVGVALGLVGAAAVLVATGRAEVALATGAGLVGLAAMTTVSGVLTARARWRALATVSLTDAVVRTVVVVAAAWLLGPVAACVAVVAGALGWPVAALRRDVRAAAAATTGQPPGAFVVRCLGAMVSSGCAALLIAGFPLVVAVASAGPRDARTGALLAALVLLRSPLLMVVFAYRPLVLHTLARAEDPARAAARVLVVVAACAAPVLAVVGVWGPGLLRGVAGAAYDVARGDLVAIGASGVLLTMLVVTGMGLVAIDRHRAATLGWLAALAATVVVVASASGAATVTLAGLVGPAVGVVVHLVCLGAVRAQSSPRENADSRS